MTFLKNDWEALAVGAAPVAGSGSGPDYWDQVAIGSGATYAAISSPVDHGTRAIRLATGGTSATAYTAWTTKLSTLSGSTFTTRFHLFLEQNPVAGGRIIHWGNSSGQCADIELRTDRTLRVRNVGQAQVSQTAALPLNTWIRVEWQVTFSSTAGQSTIRVYTDMESPTITQEIVSAANNDFRGQPNYFRYGMGTAFANAAGTLLGDVGISDSGWLGAVDPNFPPVVTMAVPSASLALGQAVTVTGSVSDPDAGDVPTKAWTLVEYPTGSTATVSGSGASVTFTPDKVGTYVVLLTATDRKGVVARGRTAVEVGASTYRNVGGVATPIPRT